MSDACRLVRIEKGNTEFNTVAVACGWNSGDEMFEQLVGQEDLGKEVESGLYLPAEEVGYKETKRGLNIDGDVSILNFCGSEFGERFFINIIESYTDKSGMLWVDAEQACMF